MRTRERFAAVLFVLAAGASAGCGGDSSKTPVADRPEPAATGPLARWRRAAEPGASGRPVVIEALRECRVRLAFRLRDPGVADRVENRRDVPLEAGESVRVSWTIEPASTTFVPSPPEADREAGRLHLVTHIFRTGIDDEAVAVRADPVWSKESAPWVRIERTEAPPSALPFPDGEVALGAVGVADGVDPRTPEGSALRLDLSLSPPRFVGGPPVAPGGARHITAFVASVLPPASPGK